MKNAIFAGIVLSILMMSAVLVFGQEPDEPRDPVGDMDQCTVILKETAKPNHWVIEINLKNDEPLFGMTFPLMISSTAGNLSYDSTSFAGTRIENFAVKIPYEDTLFTNSGKGLKLNIGLIGSIGPVAYVLDPGEGTIARHYISGTKGVTTEAITVDSTFIGPSNTLRTTMLDSRTSVYPDFEFKRGK